MSSQPLALKYRPRTFADITGQQAVRLTMMRLVQKDQIPGGLFLHGGWGAGKTTSARVFACALNCEAESVEDRPCGGCPTCVAIVNDRSTDVTEIDAASAGGVGDVRAIREAVRFAPTRRYRVVIMDEIHAMSAAGFQALLKILEETPPQVVFIFATTNRDKVPDTVVSRCWSLEFKRITLVDIANRLEYIAGKESIPLSREMALAIASRSHGALRDAVMLLEQSSLVGARTPEDLVRLMGDTDVASRIVTALSRGDLPEAFELSRLGLEALPSPRDLVARLVTCLRRLLVLSSLQGAAGAASVTPPATEAEMKLAASVAPARLVMGLKVVWEYYRSVAPAADAFAAMDLVVVMLAEALSGKTGAVTSLNSAPDSAPAVSKSSVGSGSPMSVEDILASAATRSAKGG